MVLISTIHFQDVPELLSIVGAVAISIAIFLSGAKKIVDTLPDDHHLKSNFLLQFSL